MAANANAKVNGTKVITGKVRLSYANLLEPKGFEGQEPKYSVVLLIPKDDVEGNLKAINKAIDAAFEAEKDGRLKGVKRDKVKVTLRDGDEEYDADENPEYAGMMFINVSSKNKPGIIDKYKNKTDDPEEVYSGVYARASINFYAFNHMGNKGITAGLNNIQIIEKGEFLGGRASAESDFDEWEDDEDFDDMM